MVLPDYQGRSIVNLMSSIVSGFGGKTTGYPPLADWPDDALTTARHVILIIVDGLGYDYLLAEGQKTLLAQQVQCRLTSVFPSTTAAAITSFYTGVAPQQHGLTGWHVYFRELGSVLAVLPGVPRHGGVSLRKSGIPVNRFFGQRPVFDRIPVKNHVVSPARIARSDFNLAHRGKAEITPYQTLDEFFSTLERIVRRTSERTFTCAYWPELDHISHESGCRSPAALAQLEQFDAAYRRFVESIGGQKTLVLVTADHGFVDSSAEHTLNLADHPELSRSLVMPLCGERRLAYCYVKPRQIRAFEDYVRTRLDHCVELMDSQELLSQGFFGTGTPHPRLCDRIGDYTFVMKENWVVIDWLPYERRYQQIGVHGGVSPAEMYVPLCVARV